MMAARGALLKGPAALAAGAATRRMVPQQAFAVRGLADVLVEHGRGQWQTYGDLENYKQGKYQIKTFNKISPLGLGRFPDQDYDVRKGEEVAANAHAIMLRSHKLKEEEVPHTVRCIAR
jgi:D-3-phosphoglycerate dehydrogenase / 2-oxoglutarate reductase